MTKKIGDLDRGMKIADFFCDFFTYYLFGLKIFNFNLFLIIIDIDNIQQIADAVQKGP